MAVHARGRTRIASARLSAWTMAAGMLLAASAAALLVGGARGHGAVTFPAPRQALDRALKIGAGCPIGPAGKDTNGQACFWFSNGCNIGCDACDGTHPSPGHDDESYNKFLFLNKTKAELVASHMTGKDTVARLWAPKPGDMTIDPSLKPVPPGVMPKKGQPNPKPVIRSTCGKIVKPTLCDERLRTLNTLAECGTPEDIYQLSPWRSPVSRQTLSPLFPPPSTLARRLGN